MADKKPTFQGMNGCSACKHAVDKDPQGTPAAVLGNGFWCGVRALPVDSKDGAECERWEYQA